MSARNVTDCVCVVLQKLRDADDADAAERRDGGVAPQPGEDRGGAADSTCWGDVSMQGKTTICSCFFVDFG